MTATFHGVCNTDADVGLCAEAKTLGLLKMAHGEPLIDSRGLLGPHAGRSLLVDALVPHVQEYADDVVIGGIQNSGSVLGMLLADRTKADYINILVDGPRSRGLRRQIEPDDAVAGRPVVLLDNWITSGTSVLTAARIVEDAGGYVVGALAVAASPSFNPSAFPFPLHVAFTVTDLSEGAPA